MEVIAQNGHTLEVSDVDAWDEDGNVVKGKSYKITDDQNRQVVIDIVEMVQLSPGVQGSFQLEYQGQQTPLIDLSTPAVEDFMKMQLQRIHQDLRTAQVEIDGNCNEGWHFDVDWDIQV